MTKNPYIRIGGWQEANPNELLMLQAEVNYTVLHFVNGRKLLVAKTMKNFENKLEPFNFFRTHRSYIINMNCIKHFYEFESRIEMTDNHLVEVSRRKMDEFKKKYLFQNL